MRIPGQAPVIMRIKIDSRAMDRTMRMKRPDELDPVGNMRVASPPAFIPVREASGVATGLGLSFDTESQVRSMVEGWLKSPNVIALRQSIVAGLRPLGVTADVATEVARRMLDLWKYRLDEVEGSGMVKSLVWVETLAKSAGHKYLKRTINPSPPPKYRYWYRVPKKHGLTSSRDVQVGAKFKGVHRGVEGHFEVIGLDKGGVVKLRHDETKETIFVKERDLHRMISAYHAKKTAKKTGGRPKRQPKKLPTATMADLRRGEYDEVEGFGAIEDLEAQAAAQKRGKKFAIIKQPGGYMLVSTRARNPGAVGTVKGEKTQVKLRAATGKGIDNVPGRYVLMEAGDVVASHIPKNIGNFPVREEYPEGVQERRYHAVSAEQEKVDRIAKNLDPAILINTNPDAVNGAPIVDQNNAVIGGNGRTMAIQMAYERYPESAKKLKDYLVMNAQKFGISAADVRAMRSPALVRQIDVDPGEGNKNLKLLGRRMNESLTQGLDPRSEEVAVSQFISDGVTESLVDGIEPGQSLAEFLHSPASSGFVASLRTAGIIDEFNQSKYLETDSRGVSINRLNEDGRNRVERVLAARTIPDADMLSKMNPELRRVLALSTPSFIVAEQNGWPISASLKTAVEADLAIRDMYPNLKSAPALREFLHQTEMEGSGVDIAKRTHADPVALMLLQIIRGKLGPRTTPKAFRGFAARAAQDFADNAFSDGAKGATGSLFSSSGEKAKRIGPSDALDIEFGVTPERKKQKADRQRAEKEAREAEKRAEAERRALVQKQKELDEAQGDMFAFSLAFSQNDLAKSMAGGNRLMNRATWMANYLTDAAVRSAARRGEKVSRKSRRKIISDVLGDIESAVRSDPSYAHDLGAQPINAKIVGGLVAAREAMLDPGRYDADEEIEKSVRDKTRPPGTGWTPPSGRRKSWRKRVGGQFVYWQPTRGHFGGQRSMFNGDEIPPASKSDRSREAEAVDDISEVHRANVLIDRVRRRFGPGVTDDVNSAISKFVEAKKHVVSRIKSTTSIATIHKLQDGLRAIAKETGDKVRDLETRQIDMFSLPEPDVDDRELSPKQVRDLAQEGYGYAKRKGKTAHGLSQGRAALASFATSLKKTYGKTEAMRVLDQIAYLQESRRGESDVSDAARAIAPPAKRMVPKKAKKDTSQIDMFGGGQRDFAMSVRTIITLRKGSVQ